MPLARLTLPVVMVLLVLSSGITLSAAAPTGIPKVSERAVVGEIVDGDTLHIFLEDGTPDTVRLIGIDTPEVHEPNSPVECYGVEASERLEKLLTPGREIWLERDKTERDRYDRLLRYVWVEKNDGGVYLANEVMVRDGFAIAKRYNPDTARAEQLEAAQEIAVRKYRGLWEACPDFVAGLALTPAPIASGPVDTAPIGIGGNCDPSYPTICIPSGSADLDCGDITFRRFQVLPPDPHRFDGNHDGVGCES